MNTSETLAIVAGLFYFFAYVDYNLKVIRGETIPNGATWLIWAVIAGISGASYLGMSKDYWKSLIPLLNIGLCIGTLFVGIWKKRFKMPDIWDFVALAFGLSAAIVWATSGEAKYANIIVQAAIISGFVPTWRMVRRDPATEKPRPWWLWTIGYAASFAVVIMRWDGRWQDLAYPVLGIFLHASVPIIGTVRTQSSVQLSKVWTHSK